MVDGKPYVFLPRDEYDKLTTLAKAAELPELPKPDADGNYPAVSMPAPAWPARSSAIASPSA